MSADGAKNRLNKLDSFLLWVASLSGLGFSVFIAYLHLSIIPYIPIFLIIFISVGLGYVKGAIFYDSFTERIRGWNYLLLGLFTYLPLIFFNINNSIIESFYPGLTIYLQTFTVLAIILGFIYLTRKKAIPYLYASFGEPCGVVSKKIISRTMIPSFILGSFLYIVALILNSSNNIWLLLGYVIFALLLLAPVLSEEKRIAKLLPLEKYQACISIQQIEKNFVKNIFTKLFGVSEVIMIVLLIIPYYNPLLILVSGGFLITSLIGFVVGQFYADRGDMINETEIAIETLDPEQLTKLRELIVKANS